MHVFHGLWKVSGSADRIYIRFGFCMKKYTVASIRKNFISEVFKLPLLQ